MKYHGIEYDTDDSGRYYFGFKSLIERFSIPPQLNGVELSESDRELLKRFFRKSYFYLHTKYRDTFHKFNKAATEVSRLFPITQEEPHEGQRMEEFARWSNATQDILFYLDSLLAYFRILGDVTAKIIPFFYDTRDLIPTKSFRTQYRWFTKKEPNFDREYARILSERTKWFDVIAGKKPKGMRDLHFHDDAILHLGWRVLEYSDRTVRLTEISQVGTESPHDFSFLPKLVDAIGSFYDFNDAVFEHFNTVLTKQFDFFAGIDRERAIFTNFQITNARAYYSLIPVIEHQSGT